MLTSRLRRSFLTGLLCLTFPTVALSQVIIGTVPATGTFHYRVDGIYQGEAMPPWQAVTQVIDSAGIGFFIRQTVIHVNRFDFQYVPERSATWSNARGSSCNTPITSEVPDFALPYVLAGTQLAPNRTMHLTVLRCVNGGVERIPVDATVQTEGHDWKVVGGSNYPFEAIIAADRSVLRFLQPQGNVGQAIYTLQRAAQSPN